MSKAALAIALMLTTVISDLAEARGMLLTDDPPALAADAPVDPDVLVLIGQRTGEARRKPRDAEARRLLAMTFHANGLYDLAAITYRQTIELDGNCASCWANLAVIEADERNDLNTAIADADRAIALNARYAPIRVRRGLWLLDLGRPDEALTAFEAALAIDPRNIAAQVGVARVQLHRGEAAAAVARLEAAAKNIPGITDDMGFRLALGNAYGRIGNLELARAVLNSVGSTPPSLPDPWMDEIKAHRAGYRALMNDATYLLTIGQHDQAVSTAERVLRSRPADIDATIVLAQARAGRGEMPAARTLLEGVLQRDTNNYAATVTLAAICDAMKDRPKAMQLAMRATTLDPGRSQAWVQLARMQAEEADFASASESFGRAIACGSRDPGVWIARGRLLLQVGDFTTAARVLEQMIRNEPFMGAPYIGLALATAELGDLTRAGQLLERGKQLDPNDPMLAMATERVAALRAAAGGRPQ